jgi:hypothetical protein
MTLFTRRFAVQLVGLIVVASLGAVTAASAQTFVGSNVDERITVALQVDQDAVQSWMPGGWQVAPFSKGPFVGANLFVVFVDRLLQTDSEGAPSGGGAFRVVALVAQGRHMDTDASELFVLRIYGPHEGKGPYMNSVQAAVQRDAIVEGSGLGAGAGSETWQVRLAGGGELTLQVDYQREIPTPESREVRPHSAVDPSFFRIYRVNQIVDVVQSGPAGIDRAPNHKLSVSIPELAEMFDGAEQIVGISVSPSYARQTFLP